MTSDLHESFSAREDIPLPSDRSVGWVFGVVALIVALLWRGNAAVWMPAVLASAGFLVVSFTAPQILRPLNIVWFKFGMLLNKLVSPVVMFILFVVTIVPAGLLMRMRYDPMRSKRRPDRDTYWVERSDDLNSSMQNQF